MIYTDKVEDPWFAATTNASEWQRNLYQTETLYVPDEPATVTGCTSQIFYCNPKIDNMEQGCANLHGYARGLKNVASIWPEPNDLKAFIGYLMTANVMLATPDSFYTYQGQPNLLARLTTDGSMQLEALPRDQWKQEMEFITQASLASFQSNMPQASQNGLWFLNRTLCDDDTEAGLCEKLCRSQVSPLFFLLLKTAPSTQNMQGRQSNIQVLESSKLGVLLVQRPRSCHHYFRRPVYHALCRFHRKHSCLHRQQPQPRQET
jgi:hypothetical protein